MSEPASFVTHTLLGAIPAMIATNLRDRRIDARALRREAGREVLSGLAELTQLMTRKNIEVEADVWSAAALRALYVTGDHRDSFPRCWGDLTRSVRAAIGEATCLGLIDLSPDDPKSMIHFNPIWLEFAADYLAYVTRQVRRWTLAYSETSARRIPLQSFDAWLERTGRYVAGFGLWPNDRRAAK